MANMLRVVLPRPLTMVPTVCTNCEATLLFNARLHGCATHPCYGEGPGPVCMCPAHRPAGFEAPQARHPDCEECLAESLRESILLQQHMEDTYPARHLECLTTTAGRISSEPLRAELFNSIYDPNIAQFSPVAMAFIEAGWSIPSEILDDLVQASHLDEYVIFEAASRHQLSFNRAQTIALIFADWPSSELLIMQCGAQLKLHDFNRICGQLHVRQQTDIMPCFSAEVWSKLFAPKTLVKILMDRILNGCTCLDKSPPARMQIELHSLLKGLGEAAPPVHDLLRRAMECRMHKFGILLISIYDLWRLSDYIPKPYFNVDLGQQETDPSFLQVYKKL